MRGGKNENLLVRRDGKDKDFYKTIETLSKTIAYTEPILMENGIAWIENADLYLRIRQNFNIKEFFAHYISNKIISILYTSEWNTCLIRIENLAYYQQIRTEISVAKADFILCSTNKRLATQLNSITPPTDQFFANQYYLANNNGINTNALGGWYYTKGSPTIRVAVLDDGVEAHEDLKDENGNSRVLQGFTPAYLQDPSITSQYGEQVGTCPINTTQSPSTRIGHGQSCAGIIAASHNSIGIAGIAPNVKIVPVNIFARENYGSTIFDKVEAIRWAADNAEILSNSWSDDAIFPMNPTEKTLLSDAISYAANIKNRIIVFSSGNNGNNEVNFPNAELGVISVGALGKDNQLANNGQSFPSLYSNYGTDLDLVAFGGHGRYEIAAPLTNDCFRIQFSDIYTTDRMGDTGHTTGNYLGTFGGTSAACPQVSGAAALLLSVAPQLTYTQVAGILTASATKINFQQNFDPRFGYGRLNIGRALYMLLGDMKGNECLPANTITHQYLIGGTTSPYFQNYPTTWSATGALSINSSTGLATVIGTGYAKVTATFSTPNGALAIDKDVWVAGASLANVAITSTENAICNKGGSIFSLSNLPSSTDVVWSASDPALVIIANPTSATTSIRAATTTASGWVTISASFAVCGGANEIRTKQVWVGSSQPINFGLRVQTCDLIITAHSPSATNFEWQLRPAINFTLITPNKISINAMDWALLPANSVTVYCRTDNACDPNTPNEASMFLSNPDFEFCPTWVMPNPKLNIFPNPTNSLLNLQFENLQTLPTSICVQNMLGIKVLCAENIQLSADNKTNLDLSKLPEGIYILQVVYENGTTSSQKVVVQRGVIAN